MSSGLQEKLTQINGRMAGLLKMTRQALRGEHRFAVEEVRKIRATMTEAETLLAEGRKLRDTQAEIASQLDLYKFQLLELQKTVETIRVMLIVQKTALEASRLQVNAAAQWCSAFRYTR